MCNRGTYQYIGMVTVRCSFCGDARLASQPAPARWLTDEEFDLLLAEYCD